MIQELSLNGNIIKTSKQDLMQNQEIPSFQLAFPKNTLVLFNQGGATNPITMLYKVPVFQLDSHGHVLNQVDWAGVYVSFTIFTDENKMYMEFTASCKDLYETNEGKGNIISTVHDLTNKGNYSANTHIFYRD